MSNGENESDRIRRELRERRDREIQERLEQDAAAEEFLAKAPDAVIDDKFLEDLKEFVGTDDLDAIADAMLFYSTDKDPTLAEDLQEFQKARKKKNYRKMHKLVKKNRAAIKAAQKQTSSKNSCAVIGALLLVGITSAAYGVVELLV